MNNRFHNYIQSLTAFWKAELSQQAELCGYLCRRAWQGQVRELLLDQQLWAGAAAANRSTAEGVHVLLSILDGSEASLKAAARTWLELMAAQALHKFPGLPPDCPVLAPRP